MPLPGCRLLGLGLVYYCSTLAESILLFLVVVVEVMVAVVLLLLLVLLLLVLPLVLILRGAIVNRTKYCW